MKVEMKVKIKKLTPTAIIPKYAKPGDSGFDLCADIGPFTYHLGEDEQMIIPTSLSFEIPEGFEMQVRPRSGLASKFMVSVTNSPGTIDSGFRGEVKVILINHGTDVLEINQGDRIAQGVICPIIKAEFEEVDELSDSERGDGAFGHTGRQ